MKKLIIPIVVLSILIAFFAYKSLSAPKYKTYDVKKTRLVESVYASGYIDSKSGVVIKSEVSGIIEKLFVKEDDLVKTGQVLATIKNDILKQNLSETRAQLELLRQRLREDSDYLSDIRHTISIKKAVYDNALKNYERQKALFDEGLISKERFDVAERDLEVSKRDFNRHENIFKDTLNSLESQYKSLSYREKAIIADIDKHTIKSPISGRVIRRFVKEGDYVNTLNQTNEIFSIGNTNDIETVFMVDEENVPFIKNGMKVIVTADPFVNEVFEGNIYMIEAQSDRTSRLVKAKAKVDYKGKPVVFNMNVEANIITNETEGLFIPVEAFDNGYVEILEASQKKKVRVEIDKKPIKGYYLVFSGLSEGQKIFLK